MKSSEMALIDRFNEIIDNAHNNPIDIDAICRELGTSRSQLYRYIKEYSQLSISLYIRKRKLANARQLLEFSEMKTGEIAYRIGIDSPQNFSKYFSQEFGISPTAYRKQIADGKSGIEIKAPISVSDSQIHPGDDSTRHSLFASWKHIHSIIVGSVIFLVLISYFFLKPKKEIESLFTGSSIAVMPFKNLGSAETAYYSEGIADQIQSALSLNDQLKVISTTSSEKYKDSPKLLQEIAKELDVDYILEGSVLQSGNKIRINVGMVRVSDDRKVWTKKYDGDTDDFFTYLNTVSGEVAEELGEKLNSETQKRLSKVFTPSPVAYKEYIIGMQLISSRQKEDLEESIVRLSEAIELDSDFAAAYAYRAFAYFSQGESAFIDEQLSFKMAEQNSLTAIRLDETNSLAYANLGNIYRAQHKWEQAKTAYEIALKYSPNDAILNYWMSLLLRTTGDPKSAIEYSLKAIELDPLHHVILAGHISNCVFANELDLAKEAVDNGRIIFNDSYTYYHSVSFYYYARHDLTNALEAIAKADQLNPKIRVLKYAQAFYQAKNGETEKAMAFLNGLSNLPANNIARAVIYAGLNDKEKAISYLQEASDQGILGYDIKVNLFFAPYRNDPRFKAILAKFGL